MGDSNTHTEILLAGAFAAFTIDLLVYPLDTIKTRLQSRDYVGTFADTAASRRRLTSAAALRGLYQGVGSVVLATLPASGVFFTTYESAKTVVAQALSSRTGGGRPASAPAPAPSSAVVHAIASGLAELAACVILTPAEVIKQNAQMIQANNNTSTAHAPRPSTSTSLQALRMLLLNAEEGGGGTARRRLLSGYTALAARNLPFTALQFPMFEWMRERLRGRLRVTDSALASPQRRLLWTGGVNGLAAGTSGAIAAVVTTPFDVVKTRMMLGAGRHNIGNASAKDQTNGLRLARRIHKEHGVRGLFRGGLLRAGWTFVGSGLYLGTYEMAKVWLRDDRADEED